MIFFSKYLLLSSTKKRVFANITWSVIGKIVELLNGLLVGVIVARYLQPERYGILNYAIGFAGMFALLSEFGITGMLIRELSKKSTNKNELMGSAIGIRLLFALVTFIVIFIAAWVIEDSTEIRVFIMINAFNYFILAFSMTFKNFFVSQIKNEFIVRSEIYRAIVSAIIKLVLVFIKADLIYFIAATVLDTVIILLFSATIFKRKYGAIKSIKFDLSVAKMLMWNSFPLLIEGIAAIFYQKIDVVIAGRMLGPEAVGYYSVALKFINFAIFIPLAITQTVSPLLTQKFEQSNFDANNKDYIVFKKKIGDIIVYSGLTMSILLFLFAKPIIEILYGTSYLESVSILKVLAWKGLFCGMGYVASIIILTEGRQKYVYLTNIIGGIINLGLNFILVPIMGLMGVAVATIVSFGFGTYIANAIIPLYQVDFKYQTNFLFNGGFRLMKDVKSFIRNLK